MAVGRGLLATLTVAVDSEISHEPGYEFRDEIDQIQAGSVLKYRLVVQNQPISFKMFIDGLLTDAGFRQRFNDLLVAAPFRAFRFETPALTDSTLDDPFELVLINAPHLSDRQADAETFAQHFSGTNAEEAVEFKSLGGDATLIAPTPIETPETYNHLASFVRNAPASQIDALWQMTAQVLMRDVGNAPLWLNTEGSGVAWLHVRIDSRPKYYSYTDYKSVTPRSLRCRTSATASAP